MSKAELLVSRLEHCRSTGSGKWQAACPAHDDRSPSLSVKELDDGRVLIHCHAGCGAADVIQSVGMQFSDLYSGNDVVSKGIFRKKSDFPTYDELMLTICDSVRDKGKKLTQEEKALEKKSWLRSFSRAV